MRTLSLSSFSVNFYPQQTFQYPTKLYTVAVMAVNFTKCIFLREADEYNIKNLSSLFFTSFVVLIGSKSDAVVDTSYSQPVLILLENYS